MMHLESLLRLIILHQKKRWSNRYKNYLKNIREGIEDVKLYLFDNKIHYIGTYKCPNQIDGVIAGIFTKGSLTGSDTSLVKKNFESVNKVEKNWVYYTINGILKVIYEWYPLKIGVLKNNCLDIEEVKDMPNKGFRGSTCGYTYNNEIWFIVHTNRKRTYENYFIVFDLNMNLVKYSEPFNIEHTREFICGLLIEDERVIITYSVENSNTFIKIYNMKYIKESVGWIYA